MDEIVPTKRRPQRVDHTGKRFGMLTITGPSTKGDGDKYQRVWWNAVCDCGAERTILAQSLVSGKSTSCGSCAHIKHGEGRNAAGRRSPEYVSWQHMKDRCLNPRNHAYARYGGRGITICTDWVESFEQFLADMGRRPAPDFTLDRIDNEQGYSPANCRWADKYTQTHNRAKGGSMTVTGAQIVAVARADIGKEEVPLGSNSGPYVESCQHDTFLSGTGWPWCMAAVCHWAAKAGVRLSYAGAGAHDVADHYLATRQTAHTTIPGDVVDYNIGTGHTGILVGIDFATGTVHSIDGNWGDRVSDVTYHRLSEVRCFWRIPGVSNAKPVKPRRLPLFTIATSAHGHRKILYRARHKRTIVRWLMRHTLVKVAPGGITISRPKAGR